jgi:hypothetical protein
MAAVIGDGLLLAFSVVLPWSVGTLLVWPWIADPQVRPCIALGYGYFLGLFAMTLVMRALALAAIPWHAGAIAGLLALLGGAAAWVAWRRGALAPPRVTRTPLALPARVAFVLLVLLLAWRTGVLATIGLASPLVPLDAWSQWASKARVWFEHRTLVPFVESHAWLAQPGVMHFTDSHPGYSATVPLFQVWPALLLGRWDESLVNAAWAPAYAALALAFHGQLRRLHIAPLPALAGTYALASLPFLTIYIALPGLADFFVASAFGLAAASLWHWTRTRAGSDLGMAIAMAVLCAMLKREGLLWDLALVPAVLMAWRRSAAYAAFALAAALFAGYLLLGPAELEVADYIVFTRFRNVLPYVLEHFLLMDNWHLLWYVVAGVAAWRARILLADGIAPATATIATGAAFIAVIYSFTSASIGVIEESLTNRLPLQMVPALAFYVAMLIADARPGRRVAPAPSLPVTASSS